MIFQVTLSNKVHPEYRYCLRCTPVEGNYQAYLTAYDKRVQAMGHSLADAGRQESPEAVALDKAHSYTWYVVENINSPKRRVDRELPLEEAIQLYASLKTGDKQLSVTKDGLASVDLVIRKGDLEWFPEERLLSRSFAEDDVIAGAVAQLRQALGKQIVGRISFANGEQFDYTDPQEYISAIREELPYHPTTGFRYETLTSDPEVRRAVDAELYDVIEDAYGHYDNEASPLYPRELLREVLLGLHSLCRGAESKFFNGHTNITSSRFLVFGVKGLLQASGNVKNAMLFNVLSFLSDKLLTVGNTVATLDELYIWLSNVTTIEYIRNTLKRVRKKESALVLASQNLEDFDVDGIRELTRPLFAIPTHQFLFNAGSVDKKFYMDNLQLEGSEYELIRYPQRGVCLYKCGNERYLLEVHAPEYKAKLFGKAGGR